MTALLLLRRASLILIVLGAPVAVALTLYAGRHNKSVLLMLIFAVWVLSPFVALIAVEARSKRWPATTQTALDIIALVVTLATLTLYAIVAFVPTGGRVAPVFVVVPPASLLLMAIVIPIAARFGR